MKYYFKDAVPLTKLVYVSMFALSSFPSICPELIFHSLVAWILALVKRYSDPFPKLNYKI